MNLRDLGNINREGGVVFTLHKHQSIHDLLPFIQYRSISKLQVTKTVGNGYTLPSTCTLNNATTCWCVCWPYN